MLRDVLDNCHGGRNVWRVPAKRRNLYHPPQSAPRTAWARHLDAYMRGNGLSVSGLYRLVYGPLGYSAESRTAFRPFLVDREPDEAQARALASVVGWPDEPEPAPAPAPAPDLASALLALAGELAALREERRDLASRVEDLSAQVDLLVEADRARRDSAARAARGAALP